MNIRKPFTFIWSRKKEKKVWIPAGIVVIFVLSQLFGGSANADVFTYTVEPKEFVQQVALTGKVIAAKNVDMGFETSSRVEKVHVKVGDRVKQGQVLASLSNGDFVAAVQKNTAMLEDLTAQARDVDRKLAEDNVSGAEADLRISEQALLDEIRDMYAKADDAIRFNIDPAFRDPRSQNPEFTYLIDQNTALRESLKYDRVNIGSLLTHVNDAFSIERIQTYRTEISTIQKFINDVNTAISIVSEKANSSNDTNYTTQVNAHKTSIALARTTFANALSSLNQAEAAYKNDVNAVTRAKNELRVVLAGATSGEVAVQKANIQSAQAQLTKTLIRAPFDGIITTVDIKEGEISSPNKPVISMLNDGEYQIETFVSENDIAKLKVNQPAKITLDAYGRNMFFDAVVISVDPAETVKDGVSTYRTKIQFVGKDERVKSGMTANITIETDRRMNILQIPQAAVVLDAGVKKVRVLQDTKCAEVSTTTAPVLSAGCVDVFDDEKATVLVPIQTGEINSSGDIEILSGVTSGQSIIYSTKAK